MQRFTAFICNHLKLETTEISSLQLENWMNCVTYWSAIRRNELLICAVKWMNLKCILLS